MDSDEAVAIVTPVLEQLFQDNTLEQTLVRWANFAHNCPEQVGPVLAAFGILAEDASLDLRPILLRHGWINLFHTRGDGEPMVFTAEEHRQWLRELMPRLRDAAGAGGW